MARLEESAKKFIPVWFVYTYLSSIVAWCGAFVVGWMGGMFLTALHTSCLCLVT